MTAYDYLQIAEGNLLKAMKQAYYYEEKFDGYDWVDAIHMYRGWGDYK